MECRDEFSCEEVMTNIQKFKKEKRGQRVSSLRGEAVDFLLLRGMDLWVGASRVGSGGDAVGFDLSEDGASSLNNGRDIRASVRVLLKHLR